MPEPDILLLGGLIGLAVFASLWDLKERRIPNLLTVPAFLLALGIRASMGWPALGSGLAAAGVAFGCGLVFFVVGGLGGGDVKLLTAVGAFIGWGRLDMALLVMALVGGAMGAWTIWRQGSIPEAAANIKTITSTFGKKTFTGWKEGEENKAALTLDTPGVLTVAYGVAIAVGGVASWFL